MAERESEKTINWATTALGTFACTWTFLAWLRTTGPQVSLPIVDKITVAETLVYSIPLLFSLLVLLYLVAIKHNQVAKRRRRLERITLLGFLVLIFRNVKR
jgi:hypothetical protein